MQLRCSGFVDKVTLGGQELVRNRYRWYFSNPQDDERTLAETKEGSPSFAAVRYAKGGLGMLAVADLVGPAQFNAALQAFMKDAAANPPPKHDANGFYNALLRAGDPELVAHLVRDIWTRRITYKNVATDAVFENGQVSVVLTAHRFDGGAGADRHEMKEDSLLPVGGIDCDGNPVILSWRRLQDSVWSQKSFDSDGKLRLIGFDPWNEMLDDGGKTLTEVKGNTCPAQ